MAKRKLRDVAADLGMAVGCGDNSCIWGSPGGMATNGGCRCLDHRERGHDEVRREALRLARVAQWLLD